MATTRNERVPGKGPYPHGNVLQFPRRRGRKRRRAQPADVVQLPQPPAEDLDATPDTYTAGELRAWLAGRFLRFLESIPDPLVFRLKTGLLGYMRALLEMIEEVKQDASKGDQHG